MNEFWQRVTRTKENVKSHNVHNTIKSEAYSPLMLAIFHSLVSLFLCVSFSPPSHIYIHAHSPFFALSLCRSPRICLCCSRSYSTSAYESAMCIEICLKWQNDNRRHTSCVCVRWANMCMYLFRVTTNAVSVYTYQQASRSKIPISLCCPCHPTYETCMCLCLYTRYLCYIWRIRHGRCGDFG